jgi:hypothetical protein
MKIVSIFIGIVFSIVLFTFGFVTSCANNPINEAENEITVIEAAAMAIDTPAKGSCPDLCREEWEYCRYTCDDMLKQGLSDGQGQNEEQRYFACMNVCNSQRSGCEWEEGNFVKQTGHHICHLNVENYYVVYDIKIYTADPWVDSSCHQYPPRWQKSSLERRRCGFWNGVLTSEVCGGEVSEMIDKWSLRGYTSTFTGPNKDQCPRPRY